MSSRVLLVEDAPDVQLIVADLLRGHGHDVFVKVFEWRPKSPSIY